MMKRSLLVIGIIIFLFTINVKADMEPPVIAIHDVMVTNKDGAQCYDDGKKATVVIPYGTNLKVSHDISGSYIYVESDDYNCYVKYSDVSSKTQKFSLDSDDVEKITSVRGIVLAKSGLNMRKGPSVTYAKVMTVPQNAIIKLTHKAGSYWYYAEYNGTSGWITGMNGYFGYEGKEVLYSPNDIKIYSTYDKKAVIGKIPANTEITDYVNLVKRMDNETSHYVIYNGTKGYVENMMYKTDGIGKIKLIKDYEVVDETGKPIKKITANQELEYNMVDEFGGFYFFDKKLTASIPESEFEYVNKVNVKTKSQGYIGEGLFGEEKKAREELNEPESTPNENKREAKQNEESMDTKTIIIICLLAGILLALTSLVIIKIVNNKKKPEKYVINNQQIEEEKDEVE